MSDPWNFGEFVGQDTFKRGFEYFRSGRAHGIAHTLDGEIVGQVEGSGRAEYSTLVSYEARWRWQARAVRRRLQLPGLRGLQTRGGLAADLVRAGRHPAECADCRRRAGGVGAVDDSAGRHRRGATGTAEPLGLAFELIEPTGPTTVGRYRTNGQPGRLGVRPVRLGKRGKWIRTGISWADLSGPAAWGFRVDHVRLLRAIVAADPSVYPWQHGASNPWIALASIRNPVIWDLLDEAAEAELPLMTADGAQAQVRLASSGATFDLEIDRDSLRRPHGGADVAARR